MLQYNLAAEYATLALIVVILISFARDYERKTLNYRFLRFMYILSFFSSLFTLIANELGANPQTWSSLPYYVPVVFVSTVIYFILLPSLTSCYLFFCLLLTSLKTDSTSMTRRIFQGFLPFGVYLLILSLNLTNGGVFSVTLEDGYIRGPLFQLPFYLAGLNIVVVLYVIGSQWRRLHKETAFIIIANMILAIFLLFMQAINSLVIMTGLCNTLTILALQLYTQNSRKSVDPLTGFKNNLALRYTLDDKITKQGNFSLYILSLRGFKSINERNGLEFGDSVLVAVSRELLAYLPHASLFRYNGDEFAVLLQENPENEPLIRKVIGIFQSPILVNGHDSVHIDLVCARVDNGLFGSTTKELITSVDYSVSLLKQTHGEPRYLFDPDIVKQLIDKSKMILQIKEAIDHRKFQLCYQPIYNSASHSFTQAEALVRMLDDDGELISPNEFIDVAEVTGLVVPMTYVILDIVCEDMRKLLDTFGADQPLQSISVNFSYHMFLAPQLEERIMEILDRHQILPQHIKIEITERTLISDAQYTRDVMDRLQSLGFIFELDDFGVDYSNMSTFLNLPLHIVKIDRSVLLSALDSPQNMKFFHHLVAGIGVTGRIIIVEGIESKEQLDFVLECGCEYIQGYYFSRPLLFHPFSQSIDPSKQFGIIDPLLSSRSSITT